MVTPQQPTWIPAWCPWIDAILYVRVARRAEMSPYRVIRCERFKQGYVPCGAPCSATLIPAFSKLQPTQLCGTVVPMDDTNGEAAA